MKKVLEWCLSRVVLILAHIDTIGIVFAVSIIMAMFLAGVFDVAVAASYLGVAWKVYVGIGIFSFVVFVTFSYQHCCVGLCTFRSHLRHTGVGKVVDDLVSSAIWPLGWATLRHTLRNWHLTLPEVIIDAVKYWLVGYWRGIKVIYIDYRTNDTTTSYVNNVEEVKQVVDEALRRSSLK